MNFIYSLLGLILGITCLILVIILAIYRKTKLHVVWLFFNLAVAIWGFGAFLIGQATTSLTAVTAWRLSHIGVIFIAILFFHTATIFCNREAKLKKIICFSYLQGFFFLCLNATPLFISKIRVIYDSLYYIRATGLFYPTFFFIWVTLVVWGHVELFMHYRKISGIKKNQILYFFTGTLVGFLGGTTNFFPMFKIDIYPFGNFTIPLYCIIVTYAILKYRLMDIKVAITRSGIFLIVYAFVLGLPFWFGFRTHLWAWAVVLMGLLATSAPFIYNYISRKAEDILLAEQKKYHNKLKQLSTKILEVKDLDKLLKRITWQVYRAVKVEFACLYLYDNETKLYIEKSAYPKTYPLFKELSPQSDLIKLLLALKRPLLEEEIDFKLEAGLITPCFRDHTLIGFLILGKKKSKNPFTSDDAFVFQLLSNQASLAIENCLFWKEEKLRLAKEEQIRRQRAMDHFSASMAHEIQNPITGAIGTIAGLEEVVAQDWRGDVSQDKIDYLKNKLTRAVNNLLRISKMIRAVREFSRSTEGEFSLLKIDEVVEDFLSIVEPQLKYDMINFKKEIESDILIKGNKIHLEEVLINLATNAIHAVRYNSQQEKMITLKIKRNSPYTFLIEFKDNGYGIKKELLDDIFLDFVTTKASTEGTGMGLARVRKIVENHKGKIWAESEGQGKGATFFIELPLAKKK
jgi:signal transduction histidine kinase